MYIRRQVLCCHSSSSHLTAQSCPKALKMRSVGSPHGWGSYWASKAPSGSPTEENVQRMSISAPINSPGKPLKQLLQSAASTTEKTCSQRSARGWNIKKS